MAKCFHSGANELRPTLLRYELTDLGNDGPTVLSQLFRLPACLLTWHSDTFFRYVLFRAQDGI